MYLDEQDRKEIYDYAMKRSDEIISRIEGTTMVDKNPMDYAMTDMLQGLKVIREVLNWASDSSQERENRMVWLKNSIDGLLRGEKIKLPERRSYASDQRSIT